MPDQREELRKLLKAPVITWDKLGAADYNMGAAVAQALRDQHEMRRVILQARKDMGALNDIGRMGVSGALMNGGGADRGGMGDIRDQINEPGSRFWERYQGQKTSRPERAIAKPADPTCNPATTPLPPQAEPYRDLIMGCLGPTIERVLRNENNRVKCRPQFVQQSTWIEPPVTAIPVDVFTPASGVSLTGNYPNPGVATKLITVNVTDRWVAIVNKFGNELESSTAFGKVRFSMQRNRTPVAPYANFDVQLGRFVTPTEFGAPVTLKHKDVFEVWANSVDGNPHTAFVRIIGWAFAVNTITGDGGYDEFCTF